MRALRLVLLVAIGGGGPGCTRANPEFCELPSDCPGGACVDHACASRDAAAPDDGAPDAAADAAPACVTHAECGDRVCDPETSTCTDCAADACAGRADELRVCDATSGRCVACTESGHCPQETPICRAHACGACAADEECEARPDSESVGVCEEDGRCVGEDRALFVDATAVCGSADGTAALPFCTPQEAIDHVAADTRAIVLRPGDYPAFRVEGEALVIREAPGAATVPRISLGAAGTSRIELTGAGTDVTLRGLVVSGASAWPAAGVTCRNLARCRLSRVEARLNSLGIDADDAPELQVSRTLVADNAYGGIRTSRTDFSIVNTLVYANGSGDSPLGGAYLGSSYSLTTPRREFRFNTVFDNRAVAPTPGGVACAFLTVVSSSILWSDSTAEATAGTCAVDHSVIADPLRDGQDGNVSADPAFVDPIAMPPDLHIGAGSPAIGLGVAADAPDVDRGGQARADGAPDSGSDELD